MTSLWLFQQQILFGGISGWESKVSNKFWQRFPRKMGSSNLTVSQQKKKNHCFYGTKNTALVCAVLSEPSASITRVRSDNIQSTRCLSKMTDEGPVRVGEKALQKG